MTISNDPGYWTSPPGCEKKEKEMTTTETPPDSCPHCGAAALTKHFCHCGAEKVPPADWTVYECETWKGHENMDGEMKEGHRGDACYERELARLRAELAEATAHRDGWKASFQNENTRYQQACRAFDALQSREKTLREVAGKLANASKAVRHLQLMHDVVSSEYRVAPTPGNAEEVSRASVLLDDADKALNAAIEEHAAINATAGK
jgi:hypothetical protein